MLLFNDIKLSCVVIFSACKLQWNVTTARVSEGLGIWWLSGNPCIINKIFGEEGPETGNGKMRESGGFVLFVLF